ncbi:prepilin-type N-terminal cleavage/methylation domain-containing protein [Planococcus glaciei]|uniref:type IV pilus modification PilV family protein n=1 Tax=Planococcus glaciei TaxID=459472 RepID=UPI0008912EBE|nr:type II secretion system protein [Planococcus glaciei]SDI39189.1 prepilin-type N-terminal cleavage/methylation domain-containing protein [Planococcus glaciei]
MKKLMKNEQGLTLVEILATLVLLGIVFVGIMSVFSQMTLFNDKTYTKLDTMNLARQEMSEIKGMTFTGAQIEILSKLETDPISLYVRKAAKNEVDAGGKVIHYLEKNEGDYRYELRFYEDPKFTGQTGIEKLYQVHLIVKSGDTFNSETFGYIEGS